VKGAIYVRWKAGEYGRRTSRIASFWRGGIGEVQRFVWRRPKTVKKVEARLVELPSFPW
jgi:hypothetical protein